MIRSIAVIVTLLAGGLVGCGEQPASHTAPAKTSTSQAADSAAPATAEAYPIDYCVVSGEKLGDMGDVHEVTVQGRVVKLCCPDCEAELRKNPAKYLAILDKAAADAGAAHESHEGHDH